MVERELIDLRKRCVVDLLSCVENVAMILNGEEKEKEFTSLRSCIEEYCILDARQSVVDQALEKAKAETNLTNLESLQERFKSHLCDMARGRLNLELHPDMLELNQRIQKAQEADSQNLDESDLAITETQNRFIDPITKKAILDPVKNTVCGHVYERDTIMVFINTRKNIKCPVVGCGNRTPLKPQHITSDDKLRLQIKHTQQ